MQIEYYFQYTLGSPITHIQVEYIQTAQCYFFNTFFITIHLSESFPHQKFCLYVHHQVNKIQLYPLFCI